MKKSKIFFFLIATLPASLFGNVIDKVVAKVGADVITMSELVEFGSSLKGQPLVDDLLLYKMTIDDLKKNRENQLSYLIDEKILDFEIRKSNGGISVEKVEQEIGNISKRNGMSRSQFLSSLKAQGIPLSSYQKFIKDRLERQSLIESQISSRIRVSDEDIVAEYNRTYGTSKLNFEVSLSHIFFNPKKGGPEAAKTRADSVLQKLNEGQSFESLAEQNSQDPNFSNGGFFGIFKSGEMNPIFEKAVENLDAGQVTGIVNGKQGLHILKVVSKKPIPDPQFLAKKDAIQGQLFEAAFKKQFSIWLEQRKKALEVSTSL